MEGCPSISPQRDSRLPAKQNSEGSRGVSSSQDPSLSSIDDNTKPKNSDVAVNKARSSPTNSTSSDKESNVDRSPATPVELSDITSNVKEGSESLTHVLIQEGKTKDSLPPSNPEDAWHLVYQELRAIRERVASLEKIEKSTELHTQQLAGVIQRTSILEDSMGAATTKIKVLDQEVSALKTLVASQGNTIADLQQMKEEMLAKNAKTVADMDKLIRTQQGQVDGFHAHTTKFKNDIMVEVDGKINEVSREVKYDKLKSQARFNKNNLVITGLKEEPQKTDLQVAITFFEKVLKIPNLDFDTVYRLGAAPQEGSSYIRPLVVEFPRTSQRRKVWAKKVDITEDDGTKIRIHADLPKRLRDDSQLLNRVVKAAQKNPKFRSAKLRDYKLVLHGNSYAPNELEKLPKPLRPSSLATPRSTSAIAFFSKHSELSNHYQSSFSLQGIQFHSMEHYLAYSKAKLTGHDVTIERALKVQNPVEAKAVLNSLKNNHNDEWKKQAPAIAEKGLRAKFRQNQYLLEFLLETEDLQLGEASRDTFWGVGMTLTHPDVLDSSKWPPEGNLLGRTIMKIRDELRSPTGTSSGSPRKNRRK